MGNSELNENQVLARSRGWSIYDLTGNPMADLAVLLSYDSRTRDSAKERVALVTKIVDREVRRLPDEESRSNYRDELLEATLYMFMFARPQNKEETRKLKSFIKLNKTSKEVELIAAIMNLHEATDQKPEQENKAALVEKAFTDAFNVFCKIRDALGFGPDDGERLEKQVRAFVKSRVVINGISYVHYDQALAKKRDSKGRRKVSLVRGSAPHLSIEVILP